ncbi:hypothetical protein [Oleiharenicola lentus]|uniref:hypothetical protein n=1 Tax=Oleiharenicola lentus TaxID=2508720 RepID=UPI003F66A58B
MNFADIQTTWRSPHNGPSPAQLDSMKHHFTNDLLRRRRGTTIFISVIVTVLTAITVSFAAFAFGAHEPGRDFDFSREWGVGLLLLIPWAGAAVIAWNTIRHRTAHGNFDRSLADSMRALLDENNASRTRLKVVATLHGVLLVVLPLVVYQLRGVGKAGNEIIVPAFVVWPLLSAGILLGMRWHYQRTLLPRKRELESLLQSYE